MLWEHRKKLNYPENVSEYETYGLAHVQRSLTLKNACFSLPGAVGIATGYGLGDG
jgi:hypothetical protein